MKKFIAILMGIGLSITLGACSSSDNSDNNSSANAEKATSTDVQFETLALGQTLTTDFCELTITNSVITNTASNDDTGLNLEDEEDSVWVVFLGEIKNTATSEVNFSSGCMAQLIVDEKYVYTADLMPKELSGVVPLQTVDFAAYVSIPDEVLNSCETYALQFGFNEAFNIGITDIAAAEYKYQLDGAIDEYGSADQIQNAETFFEYIANYMESESFSTDYRLTTSDTIATLKNGNCLKFISNDMVEISIIPSLSLSYAETYGTNSLPFFTYGTLIIAIDGNRTQGDIHYISTTAATMKSSAGEMSFESRYYDYTSTYATNTYQIEFKETDVEDVRSIVEGEDFTLEFIIKTLEDENIALSYECDEEFIDTLTTLLDTFEDMPNIKGVE